MREADQAVIDLLQELPGLWIESADIAACTGTSIQSASRIASRLAREGAIESRTIRWRSSRSRPREKYEFRVAASNGQRLPAWIEPPVYPINPDHCRLIVGRYTLTKELQPMTENEYRELPRGVRERFNDIPDTDFDDHPEVVAAREQLIEAETWHRQAAEAASQARTRKVQIENLVGVVREARNTKHATRRQLVADALAVQGTDVPLAFDTELRDDIERMDLIIESAPIAIANLDAHLVELNRRIQTAARDCSDADTALRATLDKLRLAEAWRQYG